MDTQLRRPCPGRLLAIVLFSFLFAGSGVLAQDQESEPCDTLFPISDYVTVVVGSENFTLPKKISGPNPDFSLVKGPVKLSVIIMEVFISAKGVVDGVLILRPDEPELTRPAAQAIFGWIFEPALLDGEPVPCRYILTVRF